MYTPTAHAPQARRALTLAATFALAVSLPCLAHACACGCGIFGVGTSSLFPSGKGGLGFFEYNFINQNQNRSGSSRAPSVDNADKQIKTDFYTLGGQYMFNRDWGLMLEVPYWNRTFTTDDGTGVSTYKHSAIGDVRISGVYSGFSQDMSTGITFGLKLPTGDYKYNGFDRDTEIGTGSTDVLIGGYHLGRLTKDNKVSYFIQAQWDKPVASKGGYKPGDELNAAAGVYYTGLSAAKGKLTIAPILQLIGSQRSHDRGPRSNPDDSGYTRAILFAGP